MKIFGFEISRAKAGPSTIAGGSAIWTSSLYNWLGPIRESFSGAWQKGVTVDPQPSLLANSAVYACTTGIAGDIAKLRIKLDEKKNDVWEEVTTKLPWLPVLRRPNHYLNRIQFVEQWILSKLLSGNTFVLKERDQRGIVTDLYVLNPLRVTPLVAQNGDVYYRVNLDYLSHVQDTMVIPASEIIHDRFNALWHPLIGIPPLYACGMSATLSNKILSNSTNLFGNAARPGGILTTPGHIQDDTAIRLKTAFEANYSGPNVGRLAVLGDGLKFEPMILTADSNQLIEQLGFTTEDVARAYHYPVWKLGSMKESSKPLSPEALTTMYYTDCLQILIESLELCLDEGLELPNNYGTEMDIDNLLRMDQAALAESNNKSVLGGWMKPNEARNRANLGPVAGGDTPYLQQQNYSLEALSKRDAKADPFGTTPAPSKPEPVSPPAPVKMLADDVEFLDELYKEELVSTK